MSKKFIFLVVFVLVLSIYFLIPKNRKLDINYKIYEDKENMYAGWWYCCIPVSKMDINKLPLPLFIRGDDVEYSIANHAKFITLNGICIWHMGFTTKYNPAMELYQVHRNSLIIQATSDVTPEVDFIERITKFSVLKPSICFIAARLAAPPRYCPVSAAPIILLSSPR